MIEFVHILENVMCLTCVIHALIYFSYAGSDC